MTNTSTRRVKKKKKESEMGEKGKNKIIINNKKIRRNKQTKAKKFLIYARTRRNLAKVEYYPQKV